MASTIADLRYRIDAVRRKEKNMAVLGGVCRSVLAFVGAIVAYFLIDWIFDLPYAARLISVALAVGAVAYAVNRFLIREMRKEIDDDTVALRVESRNPDLRGRLISTLQLSRAGERGEYIGSEELYAALEAETGHMSRPLDFFKIINKELIVRLAIAVAVVLVIKVALVVEFPNYFAALGMRLVNPDARFPTRTRIREPIKSPEYVARGDEITVEVTLEERSDIPSSGNVQFQPAGKNSISAELLPSGDRTYTGKLAKALDDVDIVVWLGDARVPGKRVKVIARPEVDVENSKIQFHLPAYTKLVDPAKSTDPPPDKFGPLAVLMGSTADITLTSTKPLKMASIERSDGKSFVLEKKDADSKVWTLSRMPVDTSGTFHVSLTDTDNLKNGEPTVEYPIEAKPDYPPTIKLEKPAKDLTITTTTKPVLVFSAHDDYRVRAVWLVYRVIPADDPKDTNPGPKKGGEIKRYEIPGFQPDKNIEHAKLTWDNLTSLNLKPGDQVVAWMEADDDCDANDWVKERPLEEGEVREKTEVRADGMVRSYPRTQYIKFTVVTKDEKLAEWRQYIDGLYKQMELGKMSQEEVEARIRKLLDELSK